MGEKRVNTSVAINFYDNCNNKFCQSFPTDGVLCPAKFLIIQREGG